jgi:hypothetical protein
MLVKSHRFKKLGLHILVVRRIFSDILLVLGLIKVEKHCTILYQLQLIGVEVLNWFLCCFPTVFKLLVLCRPRVVMSSCVYKSRTLHSMHFAVALFLQCTKFHVTNFSHCSQRTINKPRLPRIDNLRFWTALSLLLSPRIQFDKLGGW